MPKVTLDKEKCTFCQNCLKSCPMGVFAEEDGGVVVDQPGQCIICRACEATCPSDSIVVE